MQNNNTQQTHDVNTQTTAAYSEHNKGWITFSGECPATLTGFGINCEDQNQATG